MLPMKDLFMLDPKVIFFNHGSFGETPRVVFESYQRWERELEWQPCDFLGARYHELIHSARNTLGEFLKTNPDNLVFVNNATMGMNIIARSLSLKLGPGDEVLTSDQEYGAMDRTFRYLAQQRGFTYINRTIPVPVKSEEDFIEDFWKGVTPHTRVIFLSHVTSPTAMTYPIKPIIKKAREAGILTVIDGAHAPGQYDVFLDEIGADFYTGNLHKWVCAPKGSAFLYVRPEVQTMIEPLIVSFGWNESNAGSNHFQDLMEWIGTRDISAYLASADAIKFLNEHNWPAVIKRCHAMGAQIRQRLFDACGVPSLYPDSTDWYSQMGTASLPADIDLTKLGEIMKAHNIVVPLNNWNDRKLVRFSIQAYNTQEEVDLLTDLITDFIKKNK